jgi:hypothetical protein
MAKNTPAASLGQAMPSPDKEDPATREPDEWETRDHMQKLMDAHEIINNPVKMKAVHALAGRHNKAIKSIQDIKDYHQNNYGPKKPSVASLVDPVDNVDNED